MATETATPPGIWERVKQHAWFEPGVIFCLTWMLYLASGSWHPTFYNAHVYLANAFLHGHLDVVNPPRHFELVPFEGKYFLNYGVSPAVLMMPFVAIWGLGFHQAAFCSCVAAVTVALWWVALGRIEVSPSLRQWLLLAFAVGSPFWFDAGKNGWTWPMMHVVTLFGLMLALVEALGKRRGWLVGLGVGIALSSRQLALFTTPFFLYLLWQPQDGAAAPEPTGVRLRRMVECCVVVGAVLGLNALYNLFRFHSLTDNGYARFIAKDHPPYGIFSPKYIPERIGTYFLNMPQWSSLVIRGRAYPWLDPTMDGVNLWLSFPAILLAPFADFRKRINLAALGTIVIGFTPYFFYYWSGWVQFGCRYFMDVLPFALLLVADGARRLGEAPLRRAVYLGALVELWGITWWVYRGWG